MDMHLTDKVVLITGSTGGVGEALVKAFLEEGCRLALSSTKQEKLDKLLAEVAIPADKLLTFVVDVTKEEEVKAMIEKTVAVFGRLDVLVNNAGYEGFGLPIAGQTRENMDAIMDVNTFGPMYGMKYALPVMVQQESGSVVNIASQASVLGVPYQSAYVSSKHALFGMSKCAALEVAAKNVRVNCIGPGPIDTPMMRKFERRVFGDREVTKEEAMAYCAAATPDKRYCWPEEVASLAVFLASDRAGHITGSLITQDGGQAATSR